MTDTERCPTCGWDGDDLCRAIVLLRNENVALRERADAAEAWLAKLERVAKAARAVVADTEAEVAKLRSAGASIVGPVPVYRYLVDMLAALDAQEAG